MLFLNVFFFSDDDDDDNAELSDEEGADGDANEAKQRQRRQQVKTKQKSHWLSLACYPSRIDRAAAKMAAKKVWFFLTY